MQFLRPTHHSLHWVLDVGFSEDQSRSLPGLCRDVTSPAEAVEVYAASVMVLDADSQPERDYLADFAQNLGVTPQVTAKIHNALGVA